MSLSSDLINQFVKNTKDDTKVQSESTMYGTVVKGSDGIYVRFDGSDESINTLTPVSTTADVQNGERVTVLVKDHTATIIGDLNVPSARSDTMNSVSTKVDNIYIQTAKIDDLEADNVVIKERLTANEASIKNLAVNNLTIENASAVFATIENLETTNADVENLQSEYGEFKELSTDKFEAIEGNIDKLDTTYAKISELEVERGRIDNLSSNVADIDTLMFGSATGNTLQTSFANSVIALLGNAQIKSAMIDSVSANKITSGEINTNNIQVKSEDGKLLISDETIQISDNSRVRVQIGKDASNDYSINVWDINGNLMFSKGGITDKAIKEAIIRDDMISDTANISAHKLNIDSLFEEINGSTNTIKSTKVYFDDKKQTLDVAFNSIETDITELQNGIRSQGTQISVMQGEIESKIWQQDINTAVSGVDKKTDNLSTKYSALEQQLNGLSSTVAEHSVSITSSADSTVVSEISEKVTSLEANLTGFKSSVSSTYTTKTEFNNLKVGGRNLISGTSKTQEYVGNASGTTNGYKDVWTGKTISIPTDTSYVLSFDAKADVNQTITCYFYNPSTTLSAISSTGQSNNSTTDGSCQVSITTEWKRYWIKWTQRVPEAEKNIIVGRNHTENNVYIRAVKLEAGNIPTDWELAPEDMATADSLETLESSTNSLESRIETSETLIQQLSDSIATLVTDGNGESLMVQTADGWTFSTGNIQNIAENTSENLDNLTNEMGDVSAAVDVLKQAVSDLGMLNEYVKIGTYENEPCVEIGEVDSDFKLIITNTRILFMEGTGVPAYLNNQSLFIEKAVIEEELQQGQFVWKIRNNGNLGLIWKEAD